MSLTTELTVRKLTPPGYFNLSETAPSKHRDFMTWLQQPLTLRAEQVSALSKMILTPWLVDHDDFPRTSWLDHLLRTYGFGFFGGTNDQAAYLYKLISGSWSKITVSNIKKILDAFSMPPFSWYGTELTPQILSGTLVGSVADTGFLIYSTASSPATPADTAYAPRAWVTPAGWTRASGSSVSYCRGYISGAVIKWCAPRSVSDFENATIFSATLPLSIPSAGTLCIVADDGSGDTNSIYYSDGSAWRKNSLSNIDLGLVSSAGARPTPEAVTVFAPNPTSVSYAITSANPPPADGESAGYGTFAGYSGTDITVNEILIQLEQLSGGDVAIATTIAVIRRVKPVFCSIKINIDDVEYVVSDAREVLV